MSFQIKNTFLKVIICLTLYSCITPVDLKKETTENALIVEGTITTAKGSHSIRLSKVAPFGGVYSGNPKPVTNALVLIKDSDGKSVQAKHDSVGIYNTPPYYQAEVGKSYNLIIYLDEKVYVSSTEYIEKLNELEEINILYNSYPELSETNEVIYKTGVDIRAKYSKQENTSNYYYWDYKGVYLANAAPELHIGYDRFGHTFPDPLPCCAACFRTERTSKIITSSYDLGTDTQDVKLFFIEDDGYRFNDHYTLILKRYSLTREAFQFYKEVNQQLKIHGDIFDPPPVTIRGNISNLNDLDELVIGYFKACDISSDTLRIYQADLKEVKPLPIFKFDCRDWPNSSTIPPAYY